MADLSHPPSATRRAALAVETEGPRYAVLTDADVHPEADVYDQVNLYDCEIGADTKIDAFVYLEADVVVGENCTIRPFTFVPTGVTIHDDVFIGPSVTFTNDRYPSVDGEWELEETTVHEGASIGARAVVNPGVEIGAGATVGAGAVVLVDGPTGATVAGNPARPLDSDE
jgi:acetyltransferase-like isoleucine patch superfamily enzyme